ncbi:unnamed protein product [Blepharisma stoltei]|uniref:Uncharacterized protein n=1 Tax=Blepharisma stoltei TaxID=1481888 RepID=A0AAU9JK67_9CILI|nr:unnamed protein product [Blepharisma stoltei]
MSSSIIYALVANDNNPTPLVEVSLATGNFQLMALKILEKIKPNSSISYSYEDKYIFHYHNDSGFTFLCMTDASFSNRTAYTFLFDLKEKFHAQFGEEAQKAIGFSANKQFEDTMKERMQYFNTDPNADKLKIVKQTLDKTRDVMIENIDKVIQRGDKIELLVSKTAYMSDQAIDFRKTSARVKRHMWCKNFKLTLIIIGIIVLVIGFIVLLACGGFTFPYCS